MKQIPVSWFIDGVISIFAEQPKYDQGCDGSNGRCDCIGMVRGALKRNGIEADGLGGTNYAARKTIAGLQKIKSVDQLQVGDVVLKTRGKDDPDMPLPDRYRKGHPDYNSTWGEINFTHIGTVTSTNPLLITHMTSPTAKQDTKLGNWTYFGKLPLVDYGNEEVTEATWAKVYTDSGKTVKMRAKPSTMCRLYWDVPIGSDVILMEPGDTWSGIIWAGQSGYMMTKFLRTGQQATTYIVSIPGLLLEEVQALCNTYPNATYKEMTEDA